MKENSYILQLHNFSGPLDLLLTLVREKKMNILNINLLDLANEYIKIIANLKNSDINLAAEYLVMTSTLLKLKARVFLSDPKEDNFVQKTEANILNQLIELQQFKNIAKILRTKEIDRKNIIIKKKSSIDEFKYEVDQFQLNNHVNSINIVINLQKMFERKSVLEVKQIEIKKFNFSPKERRIELLLLFKTKKNITFEDIFSVPTINHFTVTFITVLDMVRKQELILEQKDQFGLISFKKGIIHEL